MDFSKTQAKEKWFNYSDFDKSQPDSKAKILIKNRNYDIDFLSQHEELIKKLNSEEIDKEKIDEEVQKLILDKLLVNHKNVSVSGKKVPYTRNNAQELFKSTYYQAWVKYCVFFGDFTDELSLQFEKTAKN